MRIVIIILVVSCVSAAQSAKRITGKYSNPAFGYEVTVPEGLVATSSDQSGRERGLAISLSSGGTIDVLAEANSLGWKSPMDGVRHSLGVEKCETARQQGTSFMRMGRLTATKGILICGDRVVETLLALHAGGEPVYRMTLRTTTRTRADDESPFNKLAASFQLIPGQ